MVDAHFPYGWITADEAAQFLHVTPAKLDLVRRDRNLESMHTPRGRIYWVKAIVALAASTTPVTSP
jgi:hypothetical protein